MSKNGFDESAQFAQDREAMVNLRQAVDEMRWHLQGEDIEACREGATVDAIALMRRLMAKAPDVAARILGLALQIEAADAGMPLRTVHGDEP